MRIKALLVAFSLLVAGKLFCQTPYTADQLRQMLDVSQRRSQLDAEGSQPFHLVATGEVFGPDGKLQSKFTIDELWKSSKEYRQILTVPAMDKVQTANGGETFRANSVLPPWKLVDADNGAQHWRTGEWVISAAVNRAIEVVLEPYHWLSPTTNRFTYLEPLKGNPDTECIGTEPDLPDVTPDMKLALTSYCMSKGNHILRFISRPNGVEMAFNDSQAFGKQFIARTILVGMKGTKVKLHVDVLESAQDFSFLNEEPPAEAQLLPFHRNSRASSGELLNGQLLSKVTPQYPQAGLRGNLYLKVHTDIHGFVESMDVIQADNQILKAPVLTAVKQWRFRSSYRGSQIVPGEYTIRFDYGGDDAGGPVR